MRQFTVYENGNPASRKLYPYLINVQSDLIEETETRVAIPLYPAGRGRDRDPAMSSLSPVLDVAGHKYVLMTPLIAGVGLERLGKPVADLSGERAAIMAALDLLISGI